MKKVLLHCCCAPCSSAILEWMMQHDIQPVIFYCNPNIYPEAEYLIRKNEITRYAHELGLTILDDDYDHEAWLDHIAGLEHEPERGARCLECFKYRLLRAARKARELGIDSFTTTLASSRWKRQDQIDAAGHWAAEVVNATPIDLPAIGSKRRLLLQERGEDISTTSDSSLDGELRLAARSVSFDDRNWRKGGLQQRRDELLRINGFYNQQYCGCEFSLRARQEQEARRQLLDHETNKQNNTNPKL